MKYAILSDVHANADALEKVLRHAANQRANEIICLGDIVGIHTNPVLCIDMLREAGAFCLSGNHDKGVTGEYGASSFSTNLWDSILWTRKQLDSNRLEYLESLPSQDVRAGKFWLMHGSFGNSRQYVVTRRRLIYIAYRLRARGIAFGFFGHTHNQKCIRLKKKLVSLTPEYVITEESVSLETNYTYLINPGTVGQPRTSIPSARYALFDDEEMSVKFHSIEYDYRKVVKETLAIFPSHTEFHKRYSVG